jgi:hypothetical protein
VSAAIVSHVVNGPRIVATVLRVQIIDVTARGFSIPDCEFY